MTAWRARIRGIVVVWLAAHATMAVVTVDRTPAPVASLTALVVLVVASLVVTDRAARSRVLTGRVAAGLSVVVVGVGASVTPFLRGADLASYPTWWPGAVSPLLVVLTWSGRRVQALVTATAGAGLLSGALVVHGGGSVPWVEVVLICGPLYLPVLVTFLVRGIFARAVAAVHGYSEQEAAAYLRTAQAAARANVAAVRRAELEVSVGPVLRDLAAAQDHPAAQDRLGELAVRCAVAGAHLRDTLTAPALLSGPLTGALAGVRRRGVSVALSDGRPAAGAGDHLSGAAGDVLGAVLGVVAGGTVTGRVSVGQVTVLAAGAAVSSGAGAAVRAAHPGGICGCDVSVDVDEEGQTLFVEVNRDDSVPDSRTAGTAPHVEVRSARR